VNDTARGRGAGTALVEQFTSWARANDAERMYVTAYAANEGALRFYARFGFAPQSIELWAPVGQPATRSATHST
ncbi:MAG: GNAT family N-acetyltransferase, partial [Thermoactinospora sp.]|nr:GNAT family N-acetyltransferase [Thermoactinospora sp.]